MLGLCAPALKAEVLAAGTLRRAHEAAVLSDEGRVRVRTEGLSPGGPTAPRGISIDVCAG